MIIYAIRPILILSVWVAGFVVLALHGMPWWGVPCLAGAILGIGRREP